MELSKGVLCHLASGSWLAPMGRNHTLGATAFYVYLHPGSSLKQIEGAGFVLLKKLESLRLRTQKNTCN